MRSCALALAGLAAPAVHVEREAPRLVAAHLALGQLGEQLADLVEQAGVGAGVGARRAPDGRLVDVDDLVQVLQALDALVLARLGVRAVQLAGQRLVQDLDHQGGLARAGHAGDAHQLAQRDRDVDVLQVVLARAHDASASCRCRCGASRGSAPACRPER